MSKESKIVLIICALIVVGMFVLIYRSNTTGNTTIIQPGTEQYKKLVRDNSHRTGSATAKVTVVEFGDFECPACAYAEPIIEKLLFDYKDNPNFNFVFRHFPLPQHKNAIAAAEAAEAAGAQGKFWEMYHLLYTNQTQWQDSAKPIDIFVGYAQTLKLEVDKFKTTVQAKQTDEFITADAKDGLELGVNSTPTFYLNGEAIIGVPSYENFKTRIEEKLK